jgi:exopolysaccharide biosynthesis polyprenyl glycosylphosphotransferase
MNEIKRRFFISSLKIFDIAVITVAFAVATIMFASHLGTMPLVDFLSLKVRLSNCLVFAAMLLMSHWLFVFCGLYQSKRLSTRRAESVEVAKATALVTVSLVCVAKLFGIRMVTPTFLVVFWLFSALVLIASRFVLRYSLAHLRRSGRNLHYILILGTNRRALEFAARINSNPDLGYRIVGFVDDEWAGTTEFLCTGYELCCNFEGLHEYLRNHVIDEVAIYLPLRSFHELVSQLTAWFEEQGIVMRFDCDIFNFKMARPRTDVFDGDAQITTQSSGVEGLALLFKRLMDFAGSVTMLIFLAPLFAVIAAVIQATSPGPVFFRQKRVGLNKRQFFMYKFRTMVPNAERLQEQLVHLNEMEGPVFKIKNDPRITPFGRFLRRTSMDELPQLLNVLMGDMSLVGPRAMSVRDYQSFNEDWQRRRFSVRPGITCLWQVNGRNLIPFQQWMEMDMQYIDKWSIWLDLKILARTIPAVLRGTGAA